jgi:hypothetical protein
MKTDDVNVDYATALRELRDGKGEMDANAATAPAPVGAVELRPGSGSKANDAGAVKGRGRGRQKADGPQIDFGALDAGGAK